MKVSDFSTFVVGNPPPGFGGRYFVFVKLVTDTGISGIGEVYCVPFHPHVVAAMIADVVERLVVGSDPFQIERTWHRIYSRGYTQRPEASMGAVMSGIEMALWDIVGKALDRPVYDLLGGRVHERLRAYTYLYPEPGDTSDVYADPDLAAERAASYQKRGFTAVKFDPAGPYTIYDPRQLWLEELDRSERFMKSLA